MTTSSERSATSGGVWGGVWGRVDPEATSENVLKSRWSLGTGSAPAEARTQFRYFGRSMLIYNAPLARVKISETELDACAVRIG